MKHLIKNILLCLLFSLPALAQTSAPTRGKAQALPGIDEVLDRMVRAIGGPDAIRRQSTRRIQGEFEIEGMNLTGSFEVLAAAPRQSAISFDVPGIGRFKQVVNGERAWVLDPLNGLRELIAAELAAYLRDYDFYRELNFKTHFVKLEVTSRLRLGTTEMFMVNAVPATGEPEQFYFDVANGMLVRHDTRRESPQGLMPTETFFSDYREVDGVKTPWLVRQQTPAFTINLTTREVRHNLTIESSYFAKPSIP
ncbi:MAG: hypothetical protein EBU88_03480 [Acidobacteria bacterium]|nr:hypothetical protein [Acidobacteriota bacterium]